ncbi:hypothetical protein Bca52824_024338 [Brassica carinata]|uniref:Uncharacterized protein n=1 Tax=Brassica carinata TaxID=52824 RepID=A0A8X7VK39_BRACI|nr:hypothetical protein Bca52824_024338 [Brassica carinata]
MSSSGTRSPLVAIPENVSNDDDVRPIGEQEEALEQTDLVISIDLNEIFSFVNFAMTVEVCFFHDEEETASAVNPLSSDAAQILPMLQNLFLNNDIQRERLTGLIQLYDPTPGMFYVLL